MEYQTKKARILSTELNAALESSATAKRSAKDDLLNEFEQALHDELQDNNLVNFSVATDLQYKEAFHRAYSNFQKHGPLLLNDVTSNIILDLGKYFPFHYRAFWSLIFTKCNERPSERDKALYTRKSKSLVNHVCAMVRLRNKNLLIHWATVATMGMWKKGLAQRVCRDGGKY